MNIKIVAEYSFIYNAADKKGCERGDMGRGKPKTARIYSVWKIEGGYAHCQSRTMFGVIYQECLKLDTLEPLNPHQKR